MKEKLKSIDWKDLIIRAVKTFIQTFISYLTIDGIFAISDKVGLQRWLLTTGLSALAGAISAVWNLILEVASDKAGEALDKLAPPEDYIDMEDNPFEIENVGEEKEIPADGGEG